MSTTPLPANAFTYVQLDSNSDPIWGSLLSGANAVGQAIQTRLLLFTGEWWESVLDGTPLWTKILGVGGQGGNTLQQQVTLVIQQRIAGTPYVTGITSLQVIFNQGARAFGIYAQVQTAFGQVVVSYNPQPPAQGLPQL